MQGENSIVDNPTFAVSVVSVSEGQAHLNYWPNIG